MKTVWKRFATSALAVVMLLAMLMPTVSGITVFWGETENEPILSASSEQAPEGYIPRTSAANLRAQTLADAAAERDVPKVLLVQDVLPWDSNANTEVLNTITEYSVVSTAEFLAVDLSEYGVIVFANDQPFDSYDNYVAFKEHIELFASIGGVIVFGACDAGWSHGDLNAALPGDVTKSNHNEHNNYIVDYTHSIVTGELTDGVALTDGDLQSSYCSHISFEESSLPAGTTVILRDSNTHAPTLIEYPLGKGRVIASGLTWEHNYGRQGEMINGILVGGFAERALDDLYTYAIRVSMIDVDDIYLLEDLYWKNNAHAVIAADGSGGITEKIPIKGATVTIEGEAETIKTDENGMARTEAFGEKLVLVEAPKFRERKVLYTLRPRESRIFYLEPAKNDGLPYLVQATGTCSQAPDFVDLRDHSISFTQESKTPLLVYFEANWNGHGAGSFVVYQEATEKGPGKSISVPAGNYKNFMPGQVFEPNRKIWVKMVAADGTESEPVALNITIQKKPVENAAGSEIKLEDGVGSFDWIGNHAVESKHEIFEKILTLDMSIESDLSPLEIAIEHNEDGTVTYKGVIGIVSGEWTKSLLNSKAEEKDNGFKVPVNEAWNEWKKQIKGYKKAGNPKAYLENLKKKYGKDWHRTKLHVTREFEGEVCGFLEITFDQNGGIVQSDGGLIVEFSGKHVVGRTFFAGPVPLYFEIKAGLEVKADGGIEFYNADDAWTFRPQFGGVELAIPSITVEGGLGVRGVATAGIQGSGKMVFGFLEEGGKTSGTLEFGGSVHIKVLFVADYKWDFWSTKIKLWPKDKANNTAYYQALADGAAEDEFTLAEREYLSYSGWWDGWVAEPEPQSGTDFRSTLQTGVMPDAMPTIHQVGDSLVMLMLADNGEHAIGNHTQLVYSVLEDGYWSEPQPVADIDGADFFYDAAVINDTLYVAWQKAAQKTRSDEVGDILADLAETSEICLAEWNARRQRFDNVQYITDNDTLDMMPALGQNGEAVSLAWVSNNENNLVGIGGTNTIHHVLITDGEPGNITTLAETEDYVTELVNGSNETGVSVLYSVWTAENESALYYCGAARSARIATEAEPAGLSYADGMYTWLEDGTVRSYRPLQSKPTALLDGAVSSAYRLVDNGSKQAFVWVENGENPAIKAAMCVDGTWCAPITLFESFGAQIGFFDVILRENGNFVFLMNTARYTDYGLEYTGLEYAEVAPAADLTMIDAFVSAPDWEKRKQDIAVYIRNNGDSVVEEVTLELYSDGERFQRSKEKLRLLPGEEGVVNVSADISGFEETSAVTVMASVKNEVKTDDNFTSITLAQVDISLNYMTYERGDELVFALTVANDAPTPANVALSVFEDQLDGIRLDVKNLGEVTSDNAVQYLYAVDRTKIDFGDRGSKSYFFRLSSLEEDWNDSDNDCFHTVAELVYDAVDLNGVIEEVVLVDPTEVTLDVEELVFTGIDDKPYQLTATVMPENASVTAVTWEVEDADIVHVNSKGKVTPLRYGTTTLTATVIDGVSVTITVTVVDPNAPVPEEPTDGEGLGIWLWVIIGGGTVLLAGGIVTVMLLLRRKKKNRGKTPPTDPQPTAAPQMPLQPQPAAKPQVQFCMNCGTPRKPGGSFCEKCGYKFP